MQSKAKAPLLILSTVAKKSDAARISKILVKEKLAACVTILPAAESRYVWKNKLCIEKELVLLIKSMADRYKKLERRLKAIHPYECPEIIAFKAEKIRKEYFDWLLANTR